MEILRFSAASDAFHREVESVQSKRKSTQCYGEEPNYLKSSFTFPSSRISLASKVWPFSATNPFILLVLPFVQSSLIWEGVIFFFRKKPLNVCVQPFL